jgi:hypothetical protein
VLLPLAILSTWVNGIVSNTDRYVSTVAPLADDPVVQQAAERRLEQLALRYIDVDGRSRQIVDALIARGIDPTVAEGAAAMTTVMRDFIEQAVHKAAVRVVEGEEFRPAWEAANRSAHEQLVAVLSGDDSAIGDDGRVGVELDTLLISVVDILDEEGLVDAEKVPPIQATFPLMDADQLAKARQIYRLLDVLGFWLPALWVICAGLAIYLSRTRRATLGWLAWGSLAGAGLLAVALWWARGQVVGGVPAGDEREFVTSVWTILASGLRLALRAVLLGVLATMAALWVSGESTPALALRRSVADVVASGRSWVDPVVLRGLVAVVLVATLLLFVV